jgi:hypothetical protein
MVLGTSSATVSRFLGDAPGSGSKELAWTSRDLFLYGFLEAYGREINNGFEGEEWISEFVSISVFSIQEMDNTPAVAWFRSIRRTPDDHPACEVIGIEFVREKAPLIGFGEGTNEKLAE